MKIDEVLKLKEAGFTSEEICNLAQVMEPFEEPVPAPAEPAEPADPKPDPVLEAVQELTKTVRAMNVINSGRGSSAPQEESVSDILNYAMNGGK